MLTTWMTADTMTLLLIVAGPLGTWLTLPIRPLPIGCAAHKAAAIAALRLRSMPTWLPFDRLGTGTG